MKPKPRNHSRADDQTTYTWALSKELKAALIWLSNEEGRSLSNLLNHRLEKPILAEVEKLGLTLTEKKIEDIISGHADRASKGKRPPNS